MLYHNILHTTLKGEHMFVAVVYKYHSDTDPKSHRDDGSWSCFLGDTKEEAIEQAMIAVGVWQGELSSKGGFRGPYQVLVGTLDEQAKPITYSLVPAEQGVPF
jgi:hypothetical protein